MHFERTGGLNDETLTLINAPLWLVIGSRPIALAIGDGSVASASVRYGLVLSTSLARVLLLRLVVDGVVTATPPFMHHFILDAPII